MLEDVTKFFGQLFSITIYPQSFDTDTGQRTEISIVK